MGNGGNVERRRAAARAGGKPGENRADFGHGGGVFLASFGGREETGRFESEKSGFFWRGFRRVMKR